MTTLEEQQAKREIEQARNTVIHSIAETMDLYGVAPSIGRLYATMYFKHHPMTLDDMKDELGMSKPSMSTSVRKLQDINIVQKVWQKGSRKDSFVAEKDFFQYFIRFFCQKWKREVDLNLKAVNAAEPQLKKAALDEQLDEATLNDVKQDLQQLEAFKNYYHWLEQLVHLMETEEIFDLLPPKKTYDLKKEDGE
ncbi:MAG TPA: GbsR/MarR family transcriptional regulator [Bacillales bacterium]|nr:GbsR/MarR family transcriptional regulator [Bacillales bacterium]